MFNLRIMCEKDLQHQQNLYHVFIDIKITFDRVWLAALWATMLKYNINANLLRPNDIQREIKVKGQKLGTVTSFKYLGATVSNEGSK